MELQVEYERLNSFFSDYTRNISKGGTFIKTSKPLEVGTEFIFKLLVPDQEEPLSLVGQVQWVVTPEDVAEGRGRGASEPGMGVRFVYRTPEDRAEIERRVEKIMVDSLGQLLYSRLMEHGQGSESSKQPATGPAETFQAREATEDVGVLARRRRDR